MFKLKLIKGRSYTGLVKATAAQPFVDVENKATADALVSSGYFVIDRKVKNSAPIGEIPVEKMAEKQLDDYAAENGIDLTGLKKKAEKLAKIQEAIAEKDGDLFNDDDGDGDGE